MTSPINRGIVETTGFADSIWLVNGTERVELGPGEMVYTERIVQELRTALQDAMTCATTVGDPSERDLLHWDTLIRKL